MNIYILLFTTLAAYFVITESLCAAEPSRSKIKRFVQKVVLGPEYGNAANVVSRWRTAPTVSVYDSTPNQKETVNEVLLIINSCLKPLIGEIHLLSDNNSTANIKIFFAPQRDFRKIAREYNFRYNSGNWGYCWMFWDSKNCITSAVVLLASDKLSGNMLRHFAFEEIIQSLGLAQDSDEFPESIFYEKGKDGGSATVPSELDLQLLYFFYQHVEPGDTRKTIDKKFEMFWPKPD